MAATIGRPSTYSPSLADDILKRIAQGETLKSICSNDGFPPHATVRYWVDQNFDGLSARYARARADGHDAIAEDAIRIADDQTIDPNSRRVMVDTRKWFLSKLNPGKYGDKLELSGSVDLKVSIAEALRMREVSAGLVIDTHSTTETIALPSPDYPDPSA